MWKMQQSLYAYIYLQLHFNHYELSSLLQSLASHIAHIAAAVYGTANISL